MDNGESKQSGSETSKVPQRRATLPSWLDGRTIAILASVVSLAAVNQTSYSRLGDDIHRLRDEMYAMRAELRQELRQEIGEGLGSLRQEMRQEIGALRDDIGKLDERLRVLEIDVAAIRTHLLGFDVRVPGNETQHEPS